MPRSTYPEPETDRTWQESDLDAGVLRTFYDSVTFTRGLGNSGQRIQLLERECSECRMDRMLRHVDVFPERHDTVSFYCLNPGCKHYHDDQFSWAIERNA